MIEFGLRHATHADCSDIRKIIRDSHLNPTGIRYHRFVVAVNPVGKVIGCGEIKPRSIGILELASIAVIDIYRKRGVARHIIECLLEHEPKRPIYVICRLEMRVFYEKFGFRVLALGEMPLYYRVLILVNRLLFIFSRRRHILIMLL